MSALTLAGEFDHPNMSKEATRLGGIHKALKQAWADEKLITFIDTAGNVLREARFGVHGSAAIAHPQIFATVGTEPPETGYTAATYQDYLSNRGNRSGDTDEELPEDIDEIDLPVGIDDDLEEDHSDSKVVEDEAEDLPSPLTREMLAEAVGDEFSAAVPDEILAKFTVGDVDNVRTIAQMTTWEPSTGPPVWIPEQFLCLWATTPAAINHWRQGLDRASKQDRARLLRCGVRRKGTIEPSSLTARSLAQYLREDLRHWQAITRLAFDHYKCGDDLSVEDVPLIAADPVAAYLDEGIAAEVVLLIGLGLDLDEQALREIASDFSSDTQEPRTSAEEALRFEKDTHAAETAELRDQLRRSLKTVDKLTKERDALTENLERSRAAQDARSSAEEQLAEEQTRLQAAQRQIADLTVDLETANADAARVENLTSELEALEQLRDQLLSEAATVETERGLRVAAEEQLQQYIRRVGELTSQLRDNVHHPANQVSDGPSLIAALRTPLAQAAAQAAARMAEGTSAPGDADLLSFASNFASFVERMPTAPPVLPGALAPAETGDTGAPETDSDAAATVVADVDTVADGGSVDEQLADRESEPPEQVSDPEDDFDTAEPRRRRRRERKIPEFTVRPLGGAGEVGGSSILVQTRSGATVLLDAGQRVKGEYGPESTNQFHYGATMIDRLDAILISHAHIDHVGSLPLLHKTHSDLQDEAVPVMMSAPTRALAEVMLNDSAKIQHSLEQSLASLAESDFGQGANMEAAYSFADVAACLAEEHTTIAEQYRPVQIPDTGLVARFLPVSHVLGSCAVHLTDTQTGATLLYTGDLGPLGEPQITLPDFSGTGMIEPADVMIMESTYGLLRAEEREGRRRNSDGRHRATKILSDVATKTLEGGGHVLLPAFSLGRTQELAMIIGQNRGHSMPEGRIYVAGMGEKITEIYDNFGRPGDRWRRDGDFPQTVQIRKWLSGGRTFHDVVAEVLEQPPGYIIASPAMLSSGWSRAFLDAMVDDPRHAVVFTGYLPKHAGNIPNLREMHQGANMRLDNENRRIVCQWEKVSLSAHAPSVDLERFAREMAQNRESVHIGLVHGAVEAQRELAERLDDQLPDATIRSLRNGEPWIPGRTSV